MTSEYDLTVKKEDTTLPNKPYKSKVYTDDEIKRILTDYIEVPISTWAMLRHGQKISYYMKEDNFFKFGGYINTIVDSKEKNQQYYCLRTNLRKSAKNNWTWVVPLDKLSKVFVYVSPEYEFITKRTKEEDRRLRRELMDVVDSLVDHINRIKHRLKLVEKYIKVNDDSKTVTTQGSAKVKDLRDDSSVNNMLF